MRRPRRPFSPRQMQILELLADDLGTEEIAERMGISTNTVRTQIEAILMKLRVNRRSSAIIWYLKEYKK